MNWKTFLTSSGLALAASLAFISCEEASQAATPEAATPGAITTGTAQDAEQATAKGPEAVPPQVEQAADPAAAVAAPDPDRLLTRVSDRWDAITHDDWIQAYDFLAQEVKGVQKLSQFLVGKEDHQYRNPGKPRLVAIDGDRGYADIEVVWTPLHGQIMTADNVPQEGVTQVLRVVETWVWHDGDWYWLQTGRRNEFYRDHPDLKSE